MVMRRQCLLGGLYASEPRGLWRLRLRRGVGGRGRRRVAGRVLAARMEV